MKEYKLNIGGKPYDVTVNGVSGSVADVTVNGVAYKVEIGETGNGPVSAPAIRPAGPAAPVPAAAASPAESSASDEGWKVTAPLPGIIVSLSVHAGNKVTRGQKVAVIEAMKMENEILAPCDGTVTKIFVERGDSVGEGAAILKID